MENVLKINKVFENGVIFNKKCILIHIFIENVLKIHKIFENGVNFNMNNKKKHIPRPQHRHCIFFSISCVTYPPYFYILNDKKWISLSLAQEGAPGVSSWSHLQVSAPKNHGSEKIFSCWKLKTVIFQQEMFQEHSDAHTPSNFLYFF